MASHNPVPASVSFISRSSQSNDDLISNLCAMPDFFIEELLKSTSDEAVASGASVEASSSDAVDLGAKRGRVSESVGSKARGKK